MVRVAPLMLALLPGAALAGPGDFQLGVGLAVSSDLGDKVSGSYAEFGPGPSLQVPLRYHVAPRAWLRGTLRADFGFGSDRVSWVQDVGGEPVTLYDDDHWAMFAMGGATLGADFELPVDAIDLWIGAEGGIAWVGTYHSLGGPTQVLLDPAHNDLESSSNVDPWTSQATLLTDVHAGGGHALSERVDLWAEIGYSLAFLNRRPLKKTPADLDATRDPWGLNALRIGAGIVIEL